MNPIKQFFLAVRFIGLSSTLRTISYSLYRDRIEKRHVRQTSQPGTPLSPASLLEVKPFHNGAYFTFQQGIKLEVALLSPHTARLTWTPGQPAPFYAVTGEETIALQVDLTETADGWQLSAGGLQVIVHTDGRVSYHSQGQLIRQDTPPVFTAPAWQHQASLDHDAAVYGLGERTRLDLRPGTFRLWNTDPNGRYGPGDDPLYVNIPVYYCQQSAGGYLAFYENPFDATAAFDENVTFNFTGGALRLYLTAAPMPKALEEYSRLTGRSPLPPRWALGFHQCKWGYRTAEEVRSVVAGFRQRQLPLDAFHFDIDYMDGYRVFTVDPERFPDFDRLVGELAEQDIRSVVILDPGVKIDPDYGVYTAGLAGGHFCTLPNGKPVRALVWPGWVHFPDFSNPETRRWWGEYYRPFLQDGIAGFWHDMNEPAAFTAWGERTMPVIVRHSLEGRGGIHQEAHNLYGLHMNMAAYNALRSLQPDRRPWLLTRSGWAGVQRYAWKWTGDTESTWAALHMTIGTVLGLGLSGIPYSGPDIGGFSGNPDPELYVRWFQLASLMPFFRNHAAVGSERSEPWQYGQQATDIIRQMLLLRRRLMPYLYTLAREASHTGAPLARPLAWHFPQDQRFWTLDDAYLLGEDLLVAPVVEQGAVTRRVLLPPGGWTHFWDDRYYPGGQLIEIEAPFERIPFFVRAGSVLPLNEDGILTLHIFPGGSEGETTSQLYLDAGDGYGSACQSVFVQHRRGDRLMLQWRAEGRYPLPDQVRVVVHGSQPASLRINERPVEWHPEGVVTGPFENLKFVLQ